MLKFAKSGLDLTSISRVTSYGNKWPRFSLAHTVEYIISLSHLSIAVSYTLSRCIREQNPSASF